MRKPGWKGVSGFETRVYRDLKIFVSGSSDFALIRSAVDAIVEAKPLDGNSTSHPGSSADGQTKVKSGPEPKLQTPTACVPFIGDYAHCNRSH